MTTTVWARANKKVKHRAINVRWFVFNMLVIFITGCVYLWLSLQNIQLGYKIADAISVQKKLEAQNHILQSEWVHLTSPSSLQPKAKQLGLEKPQQYIKIP